MSSNKENGEEKETPNKKIKLDTDDDTEEDKTSTPKNEIKVSSETIKFTKKCQLAFSENQNKIKKEKVSDSEKLITKN